MEGLQLQYNAIIDTVKAARNLYIEAIKDAKQSDFVKAIQKTKEGEAMFKQGHISHASLIQQEASGN